MNKVVFMELPEDAPIPDGEYQAKITALTFTYKIVGGPQDGRTLRNDYQLDIPLTIYLQEHKHGESQ